MAFRESQACSLSKGGVSRMLIQRPDFSKPKPKASTLGTKVALQTKKKHIRKSRFKTSAQPFLVFSKRFGQPGQNVRLVKSGHQLGSFNSDFTCHSDSGIYSDFSFRYFKTYFRIFFERNTNIDAIGNLTVIINIENAIELMVFLRASHAEKFWHYGKK